MLKECLTWESFQKLTFGINEQNIDDLSILFWFWIFEISWSSGPCKTTNQIGLALLWYLKYMLYVYIFQFHLLCDHNGPK